MEDRGKGIPPEKRQAMDSGGTAGVGIRGMRERLRQLGGSLEINSNDTGTVVVAPATSCQHIFDHSMKERFLAIPCYGLV